jgi:hypothetical protein
MSLVDISQDFAKSSQQRAAGQHHARKRPIPRPTKVIGMPKIKLLEMLSIQQSVQNGQF